MQKFIHLFPCITGSLLSCTFSFLHPYRLFTHFLFLPEALDIYKGWKTKQSHALIRARLPLPECKKAFRIKWWDIKCSVQQEGKRYPAYSSWREQRAVHWFVQQERKDVWTILCTRRSKTDIYDFQEQESKDRSSILSSWRSKMCPAFCRVRG